MRHVIARTWGLSILFIPLAITAADLPHHELVINEVLAWNDHFPLPGPPVDPTPTTPDLVELYNPTDAALHLSGLYLTDAPKEPQPTNPNYWKFPAGAWIQAKGYITVICDSTGQLGGGGQLRASFGLSRSGELVRLLSYDRETEIDAMTFGPQLPDVSMARIPDGTGEFQRTGYPTFCWSNLCSCAEGNGCVPGDTPEQNQLHPYPPDLDVTAYEPIMPDAGAPVTVTARVYCPDCPPEQATEVSIEYRFKLAGADTWSESRFSLMSILDPQPPDKEYVTWTGVIQDTEAAGADTAFEFRVHAERGGEVDTEPDLKWIQYLAGRTTAPPLVITELLASNLTINNDGAGHYDDWVEVLNISPDAAVPLGGIFLTDNHRRPLKWPFPEGLVLQPGERILVWCDNDPSDDYPDELHATFQLNASGDDVMLSDAGGVFERVAFDEELLDISLGLLENTGAATHFFGPTPGAVNAEGPTPRITGIEPAAVSPGGGDTITITGETLDAVELILAQGILVGDFTVSPGGDTLSFTAPACNLGEKAPLILAAGAICDFTFYDCGLSTATFIRGEVNGDESINIADAVAVLGTLFSGEPAPACEDRMDTNDDGSVNIADAVWLLGYIFSGGPPPPLPFGEPGLDPTPDTLTCGSETP